MTERKRDYMIIATGLAIAVISLLVISLAGFGELPH